MLMIAGIKVAGNDVFASPNRAEILQEILANTVVGYRANQEQAPDMFAVSRICAFYKLHWLALGGVLAASGAIVMHYTGMFAYVFFIVVASFMIAVNSLTLRSMLLLLLQPTRALSPRVELLVHFHFDCLSNCHLLCGILDHLPSPLEN